MEQICRWHRSVESRAGQLRRDALVEHASFEALGAV